MLLKNCSAVTVFAMLLGSPSLTLAEISDQCKSRLENQRMTVVVPNAAGGGYDTYARVLAPVIEDIAGVKALVINKPGAGGLIALTTLAEAAPEDLIVMVENTADVIRSSTQEGDAPWIDRLSLLGVFHSEPSAWVGKKGTKLLDSERKFVAAAASSGSKTEFDTAGQAIGLSIDVVIGYKGSKDTEAALLRGEADLQSNSLTTSLKTIKSGDLEILMLLSDEPNPRAPGVPFIAGPNGLTAQLVKDLPEAEKAIRMELAQLSADLTYDARAVFASGNTEPELRDCLKAVVAEALVSSQFAEGANAQGRPVTPMAPEKAAALVKSQVFFFARLDEIEASLAASQ
jgi:tripartite-type tricarboxylate transporter receptor subunit TctC